MYFKEYGINKTFVEYGEDEEPTEDRRFMVIRPGRHLMHVLGIPYTSSHDGDVIEVEEPKEPSAELQDFINRPA
ncbi:MAG TPA: hypothetical protein VMR34_01790 [Candidatus Saccharimonadales bacterium]|nr:hypothetical protein [Candidatus Saccharimonadales bacterium]